MRWRRSVVSMASRSVTHDLRYDALMKLVMLAGVLLALHARPAHAMSACSGETGWSPATATELPPHAVIAFWDDRRSSGHPARLVATIDGKPVAVKTTSVMSKPWHLVVVEIQSDSIGKLELGWQDGPGAVATYVVKPKVTFPKQVTATTSRYHSKIPHSTVREVFDGLAITLDVPAAVAHVKLRRDAKAAWEELDVPVGPDRTIRIGALGCVANYTTELLEHGVDLEVDAVLPDGTKARVKNLTHAMIPALAHPIGDKPWDAD